MIRAAQIHFNLIVTTDATLTPRLPRAMPLKTLLGLVALVCLIHGLLLSPTVARIALSDSKPAPLVARLVVPEVAIAPAPATVPPKAADPAPVVPQSARPKARAKPSPPVPKPEAPVLASAPSDANTALRPSLPEPPKEEIKTPQTPIETAQAATDSIANTDTATVNPTSAKTATPTGIVPPDLESTASAQAATKQEAVLRFPPSIDLAYQVQAVRDGQPFQGSGSMVWKSDGVNYEIRLQATALFLNLFTQVSTGKIGAQGIEPERFSDKRLNRSEQAAHFERDKSRITFSSNRPSIALQRGAQDRASVPLQLAALLAGSPERYEQAGNSISVQVASTGDADEWVFSVDGIEGINVPAGTGLAMRLTRKPRGEFDPRLEVWFAPQLNFMPVRIKQTESNGNVVDLLLRSPTLQPPP